MARTSEPQAPAPRRLRLLPSIATASAPPLPVVVPLLSPDQPVTAAQDALLTGLAQRARHGDIAARELLWRAMEALLEPSMLRCGRIAWQIGWARRNGRPWELDDLRQEAWLVFAELADRWDGEGSFIPYAAAFFSWRLRTALRRLGPPRSTRTLAFTPEPAADCPDLLDADGEALLSAIESALSPRDALVLRLHVQEDLSQGEIADRLGVSRRTIARRWARIRRISLDVLSDMIPDRME
jgi:RNA polymerase sigma factor (sigma-70 family)